MKSTKELKGERKTIGGEKIVILPAVDPEYKPKKRFKAKKHFKKFKNLQ